jgi:predicted permease
MFSYVLAFQLIFWSFAVSIIEGGRHDSAGGGPRIRLKFNMPLAGLLAGLILAVTGVYELIPVAIRAPLESVSGYAMDGILVVLGGILAGIPHHRLLAHREFKGFIIIRQLLFPALVLGIMLGLRLIFAPGGILAGRPPGIGDTWRWLQLVLVLEAAVPPATNLAIAARAFGTEEQLHYTGSGLILSYIASAVGIPLFVVLSLLL